MLRARLLKIISDSFVSSLSMNPDHDRTCTCRPLKVDQIEVEGCRDPKKHIMGS